MNTKERLENIKKMNGFYNLNDFEDKIKAKISPTEFSVFGSIWRLLIGWQKTADFITNRVLEVKTGLSENTILASIKKLVSYNMIKTKIVWRGGFKYQWIEINELTDTYVLPEKKEKLLTRANNFLKGKTEKTVTEKTIEVYKVTPEIIDFNNKNDKKHTANNEVEKLKFRGSHTANNEVEPTANLEEYNNKNISLNTNLKTYNINTEKKAEQNTLTKLELPILKIKTFDSNNSNNSKKENVMNDFRKVEKNDEIDLEYKENFDLEDENNIDDVLSKNKKQTQNSKESVIKNAIEDILKNYGINLKASNFNKAILKLEKNTIMDAIAKTDYQYSQGKCTKKPGYLLSILNKILEENNVASSPAVNLLQNNLIKTEINNTLDIEKKIVDFFFNKKLVLIWNKNIENSLVALLNYFDTKKDLMSDFKKLNISNDDLQAVFAKVSKYSMSIIDSNKKQALFNAFNDPNFSIEKEVVAYIPTQSELDKKLNDELAKKNLPGIDKPFSLPKKDDSFFSSVFQKAENLKNKVGSYFANDFDDLEIIPI